LAYYMIDGSKQVPCSHTLLIGSPLLIISLFCFAFFLVQPNTGLRLPTVSERQATANGNSQTRPETVVLPPALQKLNSETLTTNSMPAKTASPQPSGAAAAQLQSAAPNSSSNLLPKIDSEIDSASLLR
jgi:hypothetical protein